MISFDEWKKELDKQIVEADKQIALMVQLRDALALQSYPWGLLRKAQEK
jgi:hypothetical protein